MTNEEKELLLKDLCARLPYRQKAYYKINASSEEITVTLSGVLLDYFKMEKIEIVRPYLRPMSSMTEEEQDEFLHIAGYYEHEEIDGRHYVYSLRDYVGEKGNINPNYQALDWLNANHFDYRGLIEKGLAFEAPKDMYSKQ